VVCNLHLFLSEVRRCGADLVYLHTFSLLAYCEYTHCCDREKKSFTQNSLHTTDSFKFLNGDLFTAQVN
jgi:hypothetical protein